MVCITWLPMATARDGGRSAKRPHHKEIGRPVRAWAGWRLQKGRAKRIGLRPTGMRCLSHFHLKKKRIRSGRLPNILSSTASRRYLH